MTQAPHPDLAGAPTELINALGEAILLLSPEGRILHANPAAGRLFGTTARGLGGHDLNTLLRPDNPALELDARLREAAREDAWIPRRDAITIAGADGRTRTALLDIGRCRQSARDLRFAVLREQREGRLEDAAPEPVEHLREVIDLLTQQAQERLQAEQALRDSHQRLLTTQRVARIGHWELDTQTDRIHLSDQASRLLGLGDQARSIRRDELLERVHPDDRATLAFGLLRVSQGQTRRFSIRHRVLRPDGREGHMLAEGERLDDDPGRILGFHQDQTERQRTEQALFNLIHYDALTGLPNRTGLRMRLRSALDEAEREGECLAVLLLDIDRFTSLNSSLGHAAGDQLLRALAERLQHQLQPRDTLARLAADEFAIVLADTGGLAPARERAASLLRHCAEPFALGSGPHTATISAGVSLFPRDARSKDDLLRHATSALHEAKGAGGNGCRFFSEELTHQMRTQMELEQGLRVALGEHQFELHYQPQIGLHDGGRVGVEALVRWRHPQRGMVSPADFIPLAESTGLIVPLGDWILRTATRQLAAWDRQGLPPLRLAVNLSARQFADPSLPERILETLETAGLQPSRLEVEVTESVLVEDIDAAAAMLQRLVQLGVSVAIDDFGTGQSSLRYLRRLPLTTLKIDREFTWGIGKDPDDEAITRAIIGLARTLKLRVLAEGVETEEQHDFLRQMGCDEVQGFLLGRPLPAGELERQWRARACTPG
ncbi:bifunctional diguanylate cyclase/phosphodiesterase [Thioalkalivibrio sp. ALJ16]|uniref:sensor domain-containing protein n=1 Tax=Thioalkalivibrio sp. ALJ16 TaxID=1158762 RepID=UPI00036B389B|nr:bifunctional diguanylate cyclase/phosphodiesterase [Thioalkalivibrio sp. ALJ16]